MKEGWLKPYRGTVRWGVRLVAIIGIATLAACARGGSDETSSATENSLAACDSPSRTAPVGIDQSLLSRLEEKAREDGSTRIIIRLKVASSTSRLMKSDPCQTGDATPAPTPTVSPEEITDIAVAQETVIKSLANDNATDIKNYENIPFMAATVDETALIKLTSNPLVESIEEDIEVNANLAQSVPLVGGTTSHGAGHTGAGQTVAILDTGIERAHPFFGGRVVYEACFASTCSYGAVGAGAANDDHGHGTHVAGIAAGKKAGSGPYADGADGMATQANIIAIKVLSSNGSGWYSDVLLGLDRVYSLRSSYAVASINMSLGSGGYASTCDSAYGAMTSSVNTLAAAGIATVVSSGNDYYKAALSFPACISQAVSVGATSDTTDTVVGFSNSAAILDLLAPGTLIRSSMPGGGFGSMGGTSMAAPHVAGAWAVIKGAGAVTSVPGILALLKNTGVAITDTNGITKPRIQIDTALTPQTPAVMSSPADGSTLAGSSVTFHWNNMGATYYTINVGSTVGGWDLGAALLLTTPNATIHGLPTDGSPIYVRLYSFLNDGQWHHNDYAYTSGAPVAATMALPVAGSTLVGSSVPFHWNDVGATYYTINVGTTQGGYNLGTAQLLTTTHYTMAGLPLNGGTVYVRLYSYLADGRWHYNDYSYTAATPNPAAISSPADGATLAGSNVTFHWNDVGATYYTINVGTTQGGYNLGTAQLLTTTQYTMAGLPLNGGTVYVRLYSYLADGQWHYNDYSYTAATPTPASISSPIDGSALPGSSVTFEWEDVGATYYTVNVGSTQGGWNLGNAQLLTSTSATVHGLPTDGSAVHVRLYSFIGGQWRYNDYAYTGGPSRPASMIAPLDGATLAGSAMAFRWENVGASYYTINVGSTVGGWDLGAALLLTTTGSTVSGLPTDGSSVYVRVYSFLGGQWRFNDFVYTSGP